MGNRVISLQSFKKRSIKTKRKNHHLKLYELYFFKEKGSRRFGGFLKHRRWECLVLRAHLLDPPPPQFAAALLSEPCLLPPTPSRARSALLCSAPLRTPPRTGVELSARSPHSHSHRPHPSLSKPPRSPLRAMGCFQSKVAGPLPPNDAAALPADNPADPGKRHAPPAAAARC